MDTTTCGSGSGDRFGPPAGLKNEHTLRTGRLVLDIPTRADGEALFPLVHGEGGRSVTDHLCWDGPASLEDMHGWVDRYAQCPYEDGGFHWVIRDLAGAVLGSVGVRPLGAPGRADLGYYLAEPFWGRGLMREAVAAVVLHGFDVLRLHKIEAEVFTTNPRGMRLVERLGFRQEGLIRRAVLKRGAWKDTAYYGLVPGELVVPGDPGASS
jgi:RimJ/RimL family protein N-acetyltransferase